ncbi:hypothetical protein NE237_027786 [Protea cynaroides]|uniref:Uncharacterized protein n=1 Tax=Protea cynaroides TaxID=273540 RepID=A0A9Q0GP72_9MAGN|nr:hypothetical protein NE237_027786 [Protea cynaroides]
MEQVESQSLNQIQLCEMLSKGFINFNIFNCHTSNDDVEEEYRNNNTETPSPSMDNMDSRPVMMKGKSIYSCAEWFLRDYRELHSNNQGTGQRLWMLSSTGSITVQSAWDAIQKCSL